MRPNRALPTQRKIAWIFNREIFMSRGNSKVHWIKVLEDRSAAFALANQQPRVVRVEGGPVRIVSAQARRRPVRFVGRAHNLCAENRIKKRPARARQARQWWFAVNAPIRLD